MTPKEFYDKYLPAAEANYKNHGVPVLVTLAQAALESAWGQHAPGNNFFGIKAGKTYPGKTQMLTTHEFIEGVRTKVQAAFRAYDSAELCFADYAEVLKRNFSQSFKTKTDLQFVQALVSGKRKYATDPDYVAKVDKLMNKFRKFEMEKPMSNLLENKDLVELKVIARGFDKMPVKLETNYLMKKLELPEGIGAGLTSPEIEFGIEETLDVVEAGVEFANAIIKSFADGKITPGDLVHFISPVIKLPSAISGLEFVPAELDNLNEEEFAQITAKVMEKLEVDEVKAKEIVKASLVAVFKLYELVKIIKG